MGPIVLYTQTKFEVSGFRRSEDMRGFKIQKWAIRRGEFPERGFLSMTGSVCGVCGKGIKRRKVVAASRP